MGDRERALRSYARWLAGLAPRRGDYAWRQLRGYRCLEALGPTPGRCPLCGKRYRSPGALYQHLLRQHINELRRIIEACRREAGSGLYAKQFWGAFSGEEVSSCMGVCISSPCT